MPVTQDMNVQEPPNYLNVNEMKKTTSPSCANDIQNRRAFIVAGVCIGLVCIVQGTLNIVLRLYLTPRVDTELSVKSCDNHTLSVVTKQHRSKYGRLIKETKQLNTNYINLGKERDQLQKEKDEIQKRLSNLGQ